MRITLHQAIKKVLLETGRPMTTSEIAAELNARGWYSKSDGTAITDFQVHGRTKNYAELFKRDGSLVSLR